MTTHVFNKMAAPTKPKAGEVLITKSAKKRKKDEHSNVENTPEPKQRKIETITEVDFKFLLRDPSTLFSGFEKFLDAAERWPDADYDIVEGYCRSSPECTEILHVLESGKRKPQELQLIFGCLERILLRIADDLTKYFITGQHIVKKVLSTQLNTVYFAMKMTNKSSQIKTALKMLVAMVMLGASSTKMALSHLDFGHYSMKHLFNRRDTKDEEDVRTCLLHLIIAFLLSGDNEVIRRLADTKGFLETMLQGMVFDRVSTIQLVLSTVLEKIVMNPAVSKTSKVHIFTETTLKQLGQLFTWKGPTKWKGSLHAKRDKQGNMEVEDDEETSDGDTKMLAAQLGHKFLTEVCSSYKHGIVFMDKTYGLSGKNQNHILTSFLTSLIPVSHHALVQDLVIKILVASPDQLQYFIPQMVHTLSPRPTGKWVDSVGFLYKIYEELPSEPHILRLLEHKSVADMVNVLLVYTIPPTQVINTLLPGLRNTSLAVNHVTMSMVKLMADRAIQILRSFDLAMTSGPLQSMYTEEERLDLVNLYTDTVIKTLPEVVLVFQCLDKVQALQTEAADKSQLLQLKDVCQCEVSDVQVRVEQVLCLYQELMPSLLVDHPVGLGKLLDGVINTELKVGDEGVSDSAYLPQMYLLKLLAGTDARRLPWGKRNAAGHTLLYQLLEMVTHTSVRPQISGTTLELICKLLESTGLFESCHEELLAWMKELGNYGHKSDASSTVLGFVSKVLMTYMSNPYPYMDRVCDLVSEVAVMETGVQTDSAVVMNDTKMKAVLSMDIGSLEDEVEATPGGQTSHMASQKRFPFSPMLLVALDILQKTDSVQTELKSYVSSVVLDTFHLQVDPLPFCLMMKQCQNKMFIDGLHGYTQLWLPQKSKQTNKTVQAGGILTVCKLSEVMAQPQKREPCDIIQQYLLHLTYLLLQETRTGDKTFIKMVKSVVQVIEDAVRQTDESMAEDSGKQTDKSLSTDRLPESQSFSKEFSLLHIKKPSATETMATSVRLVLGHPKVRHYFLQGISENQSHIKLPNSVSHMLTEVVIHMLDTVRQYKLDIGDCFEHYHSKVLDCLKTLASCEVSASERQEISKPIFTSLKYIVENLKAEQCEDVLDCVLTLVDLKTVKEQADSICEVMDCIFQKLTASNQRLVTLSETGVDNMINCYLQKSGDNMSVHFTQFFEKFQNLGVLCSENTLQLLLDSDCYSSLAEILMRTNPVLREAFGHMILRGDGGVKPDRHLSLVESYLTLVVSSGVSDHHQAMVVKCGEMYKVKLMELCGQEKVRHAAQLLHLCKQLVKLKALGKKVLQKMEKKLMTTIEAGEKVRPHHIELIQVILGCQAVGKGENILRLLQICMQCLTKQLAKKASRNQNVENTIMDILSGCSKTETEKLPLTWSEFADVWPQFVKATLKHMYTDRRLLGFLIGLIPAVYHDNNTNASVTIETLAAMVMSHSSFLPVMLNEENGDCKESLLDLLLLLIGLSPSSCQTEHVGVFLGSYTASMSLADQKILKLLQVYERNGINFTDYKPYVWGEKAIEHHSLRKTLGPSLKLPTMTQVLANIDPGSIQDTVLNFPLRRKLQCVDVQDAVNYKSTSVCYDPCFLLPLFSHLLAPDAVVDCKKFIELDCLSFTLAALSSHDQSVRSASYHILDRFRIHLESSRLPEKDQMVYLMEFLRSSLPNARYKLASIVTLFLARTAKLMLKPDEHMYGIINSFLLLKPSLDVVNIPEFYKLFNSSAHEYKIERAWILSLMHDGLRETADYRIFEKRYTFKLLQSFYDSDTADTECQVKVLQILKAACKERTVALDLSRNHGIVVWIAAAISKLSADSVKHVSELTRLVHALWTSILGNAENSTADKPQQLQAAFSGQLMSVMQTLLWYMRDVSEDVLLIYTKTLLSVITHVDIPATPLQKSAGKTVTSTISHIDVLILLLYSVKFVQSKLSAQSIIDILNCQGYDTSLLVQTKGSYSKKKNVIQHAQDIGRNLEMATLEEQKGRTLKSSDKGVNLTDDSKNKEKQATVSELSQTLMNIILIWKSPNIENITDEMVSTNLMVVSWLIGQIENGLAPSTMSDVLQRIENIVCQGNLEQMNFVIESLSTSGEISDYIMTGLLNAYAVITSAATKASSEERQDVDSEDKAVVCMNNILAPIVLRRYGLSGTHLEQMCANLCHGKEISVSKDELLSVVLRRVFLQRQPTSGRSSRLSLHGGKRKSTIPDSGKLQKKKRRTDLDISVNNKDVSEEVEKLTLNDTSTDDVADEERESGESKIKLTKIKTKKRKSILNIDMLDTSSTTPNKKMRKDRNAGRKP